jgi:hypothetical protein
VGCRQETTMPGGCRAFGLQVYFIGCVKGLDSVEMVGDRRDLSLNQAALLQKARSPDSVGQRLVEGDVAGVVETASGCSSWKRVCPSALLLARQ